ncbi:RpnC/YadD family protein [Selenomonas sputigena]|uniref:Transposase (putative) YhgA-like domain-containing protein n=1 Tax=Selenomonas sputigena (strain ATCC 35185 / DSM 20758 / CCUG 44933 / VPI D19B-28) TaxID=546271 RepID=C9LTN2_SELS3|nr:hypothetical protein [Selenomonas sputigena]AEC00153.1 hypothetical protein Selsp_1193 [Selenomonas sputigena ATCC 35185]EEX77766.1 hypothetical protein SELSPUOL_01043 [Selenomonas sputigena ATCC 35185]
MEKEKKGRQYQDTVFRMYFNEETRLKEVAGALHGRSYAEEPLQIVTLDGTFLSQIKNDISFLLAGRNLIFLEHQSTANQNMPLRCLYYVCEQLRQYIPAKKLYQNTPIKLPSPEFHVFYTGSGNMPETCRIKLSDAYKKTGEEIHLELKVNFHNIAYDNAKVLLQKSRSIHDYSFFIDRIKRNMADGMERAQAIRKAMQYCEESNIMKEFLQQHEREVVDMVNFEWNQKDFEEAILEEGIERGLERGRAEGMERGMERGMKRGRAEGMEQGKVDIVLEMLRDKLPLETIARLSKFSMERVQELGRMHSLL